MVTALAVLDVLQVGGMHRLARTRSAILSSNELPRQHIWQSLISVSRHGACGYLRVGRDEARQHFRNGVGPDASAVRTDRGADA